MPAFPEGFSFSTLSSQPRRAFFFTRALLLRQMNQFRYAEPPEDNPIGMFTILIRHIRLLTVPSFV